MRGKARSTVRARRGCKGEGGGLYREAEKLDSRNGQERGTLRKLNRGRIPLRKLTGQEST